LRTFADAWSKLMNADRFDGPTDNVCVLPPPPAPVVPTAALSTVDIVASALGGVAVGAIIASGYFYFKRNSKEQPMSRLE